MIGEPAVAFMVVVLYATAWGVGWALWPRRHAREKRTWTFAFLGGGLTLLPLVLAIGFGWTVWDFHAKGIVSWDQFGRNVLNMFMDSTTRGFTAQLVVGYTVLYLLAGLPATLAAFELTYGTKQKRQRQGTSEAETRS